MYISAQILKNCKLSERQTFSNLTFIYSMTHLNIILSNSLFWEITILHTIMPILIRLDLYKIYIMYMLIIYLSTKIENQKIKKVQTTNSLFKRVTTNVDLKRAGPINAKQTLANNIGS